MKLLQRLNVMLVVACGFMFAAHNLSAYTHNIKNGTQCLANVHVQYAACKDDHFQLQKYSSQSISAGGCILEKVEATVEEPQENTPGSAITGSSKIYRASSYNGPFTGSGTWIISGPFKEETDANRYKITRLVQ